MGSDGGIHKQTIGMDSANHRQRVYSNFYFSGEIAGSGGEMCKIQHIHNIEYWNVNVIKVE